MKRIVGMSAAVAIWLAPSSVLAGAQFSADTVQTGPQGQSIQGKTFIGDNRMRNEGAQDGKAYVQVVDNVKNVSYIILPDQKAYLEIPLPPVAPAGAQSKPVDPCAGLQGVTCRKLGTEAIAGRPTTKWEISGSAGGQTRTETRWIDDQRGDVMRVQASDGSGMEQRLLGNEQHEGRPVEKWEISIMRPGQQPIRSLQWLDPELGIPVRQQGPDGSVRELRNIRVGPQPNDLFTVPAGFQKTQPPVQAQPAAR